MTPYRTPEEDAPSSPKATRVLGDRRSSHRIGRSSRLPLLSGAVIAALCAGVAVALRSIPLLVVACLVLILVALLGGIAEWAVGMGAVVELYDEAIVVRRSWTENATFFFDDIDAIFYDFEVITRFGVKLSPSAKLTLTDYEGKRLVVPRGLRDMLGVLRALDRKVVRPLLAPAKRALADGEIMHFGPVDLDGEGVTINGERSPWSEIESVLALPDAFTMRTKTKRVSRVSVKDVPHPRVLIVLLRTKVPVEGPPGFWGG